MVIWWFGCFVDWQDLPILFLPGNQEIGKFTDYSVKKYRVRCRLPRKNHAQPMDKWTPH